MAVAAVLLAPIFLPAAALIVVAIMASAHHALRREVPLALMLSRDGRLEVGDEGKAAELAAGTRVLPGFLVLAWREEGRMHRRVVWPDSLPVDAYRRLRIWVGRSA